MRVLDDAHIDAAAKALGLTLSPESLKAVATNQAVLADMAQLVDAVELDPHDDPLPLFRP